MNKKNDFISILKKYFATGEDHLVVFRLISILVIIFLPVFGIALTIIKEDAIEYISHRCIIAGYWAFMLLLSYQVEAVKKYMTFFTYLGVFILFFWIIWICKVNHFSQEYVIGYFIAFSSCAIFFNDRLSLAVFLVTMILTTGSALYLASVVEINSYILFLSILVVGSVYMIMISARSRVYSKLNILNQTLEEKVAERTYVAEHKTKELELKNMELERFAAVASHDLKSPLRTISSFASLIDRKTKKYDDESIREYNEFIQNGVAQMTQTIDNLLEYSRMGKEGMKLEVEDINQLIQNVLHGVNDSISRPDVQLSLPKSFPTQVICNASQMGQLFQNLIENAIKFNRKPLKKVMFSCEEQPDSWMFKVADNGIGIPDKYLDRIFEMFARLHTDKDFPGTGIGLGTCKKIVDNHGGQISVDSTLNQGTTFIFTISKKLEATETMERTGEISATE